jgi:predicted permease
MRRLRAFLIRLAGSVTGGGRRERDFHDELDSHLQLAVDDNIRAGMSPDEARRAALLRIGGVSAVTEAHRDRRSFPVVESLGRDVRWALATWRRSPGFTVAAVLSLALGIGANTAIFSIVDALVLRALPAADPGQLVQIRREANRTVLSNPLWEAVRDRHLFESAGAWSENRFNLAQGGEVDPAIGLWVSGGFFDMLGVRPAIGRLISAQDDRRTPQPDPDSAVTAGQALPDRIGTPAEIAHASGASAVAVLSYGFWQRRFGGAHDVVGRIVSLDGVPFTIVGVAQQGFFGAEVGRSFDVAVPIAAEPLTRPRTMLDERSAWWLYAFGRLRPGQTIDQATLALRGVQPQIRAETLPVGLRPADEKRYLAAPMALSPAATGVSDLRRAYSMPLSIVMAVVGIVLLIACVNLANLLLARADARRHEMSVRLALGAWRGRLIAQLLVESLMLACWGALLGLGVAELGSRALIAQLSTTNAAVPLDVPMDWRVLGFTMAVAVIASLAFGLAPAWRATRTTPNDALKSPGRTSSGRTSPIGAGPVSSQVALSLVLVMAAGLFVRTFASLASAQLGFDARALLLVNVDARKSAAPPDGRMPVMMHVRDIVRALPGIDDAALSAMTPFAGQWDTLVLNPDGMSLTEDERDLFLNAVSPDWFSTYGVAVREGRGLDAHDAAVTPLESAVINRTAARRFFPSGSAVGQMLKELHNANTTRAWRIVGVVDDAVYDSVRSGPPPTMYEPMGASQPVTSMNLTLRVARGAPESVAKSVVAAISGVDPRLAVTVQPLEARVAAAMVRERLLAYLSGFFGGLALLLAALGLYGVVSYDTSRRQREIGIRLALGAGAASVIGLVGRRVAWLVAGGVILGAAISYWSASFVSTLLFGLEAHDAATLVGAIVALSLVAAVAGWIPARRATRLDPTVVLREG